MRSTRAFTSAIRVALRAVSRLMAILLLQTGEKRWQLAPYTPRLCLAVVSMQPDLELCFCHGLTAPPEPRLTFGPDPLPPRASQQAESPVFTTAALQME